MKYLNIQGLRAIASLMVLVSHVLHPFTPMQGHWTTPYIYNFGPGGVDIFFIISGFIIYTVAEKAGKQSADKGRFAVAWDFLLKRLIRIYPIYWVMWVVAALLMLKIEITPSEMYATEWWKQFLLLTPTNNRIIAAWSLHYEMIFYAVATLAVFFTPRSILVGLLCWFAIILAIIIAAFAFRTDWMHQVWASAMFFEFLFGVLVGVLVRRRHTAWGVSSLTLGMIAFGVGSIYLAEAGGWYATGPWWRMAFWGIPSAFILYGLISIELRGIWTFPKIWQYLGNASYSIYLSHQTTFAVLAAIAIPLGVMDALTPFWTSMLAVLIATIVGVLVYHYVEKWLLDKVGKAVIGRRVRVSTIQPID